MDVRCRNREGWRFLRLLALLAVMATGWNGTLAAEPTGVLTPSRPDVAGQWLQFRGDRRLTGRSPLAGKIEKPQVRWRQFVGCRETCLAAALQPGGQAEVQLPAADLDAGLLAKVQADWRTVDRGLTSSSHRTGRFLPVYEGLQKVEFDSQFRVNTGGSGVENFGRFSVQKGGQWQTLWTTRPLANLFIANPIIGDFDHDGRLEVAATPLDDLWVFDLAKGEPKQTCTFAPPGTPSGRGYGWIGAFDLDGDGRQEFVILADFANHMEVLGWSPDKKLVRLWYATIENTITRKQTIFHPGAEPVRDIDGDGRPEIVVSVFGLDGDRQWHVYAYEAMTGKRILDLPGQYLSGMADLDGSGVFDLCCTRTEGPLVPAASELSVVSFKGGKQARRWQASGAAFETHELSDWPLNVNSCAATGRRTLLAGPLPGRRGAVFLTRRDLDAGGSNVELTSWGNDVRGTIESLGRIAGQCLEALALGNEGTGNGHLLIKATTVGQAAATIRCQGISVRPVVSRTVGGPASAAVVGRLQKGGPPLVVAAGAAEMIHAVAPPSAGKGAQVLWSVDGRGVLSGSPLLADLRGDGNLAAIAVSRHGAKGCARVLAYDAQGKELWRRDFEAFPGADPPWNVPGFTHAFAGRFTDPNRDDVMVSFRRSSMHSDETFVLDGRSGATVWRRTEGGSGWGCGGGLVAVYDHDGDGRDDALTFYPHVIYVMRGSDGRLLFDRLAHQVFACDAYYARPVVGDILGNGKLQWLFCGTAYVNGLLDPEDKILWRTPPRSGTPAILPGVDDIDGDGKLEILMPGHQRSKDSPQQSFHCLEAATGKLKWALDLPGGSYYGNNAAQPAAPQFTATADLDGDGRQECLFDVGNELYCVGAAPDGRSGQVRWKLPLPGQFGPPAIADVKGDGAAEIVVVCSDGYVYGIQ